MNINLDSIIEKRIKEKLKKECINLYIKKASSEKIINELCNKFDKNDIIQCLKELKIYNLKQEKNEYKQDLNKKDINSNTDKIINLINNRKTINTKINNNEKVKEYKENLLKNEFSNNNLLKKIELKEEKIKPNNIDKNNHSGIKKDYIKKEIMNFKKMISNNPKISIALFMIFIFISALIFVSLNQYEKGKGSCPYVSKNDIRKMSEIFYEKRGALSYMEYDEIIGSYFGKDNCIHINKRTINELRNK